MPISSRRPAPPSRRAPAAAPPDPFAAGSRAWGQAGTTPPRVNYDQDFDWGAYDAELESLFGDTTATRGDIASTRADAVGPTRLKSQVQRELAGQDRAIVDKGERLGHAAGMRGVTAAARIGLPMAAGVLSGGALAPVALATIGATGVSQGAEMLADANAGEQFYSPREQLGDFVGSLLGNAINVPAAGAFVRPGTSRLGRAAAGAAAGMVEGAAGNVADNVGRSVVAGKPLDYDSLQADLGLGAGMGTILGGGFGALSAGTPKPPSTTAMQQLRPGRPNVAAPESSLVGRRQPYVSPQPDELDEMVLDVEAYEVPPPAQLPFGGQPGAPQLGAPPAPPQLGPASAIVPPAPGATFNLPEQMPPVGEAGTLGSGPRGPAALTPSSADVLSPEYLARVAGQPRPAAPEWSPDAELNRMVLDELTANEPPRVDLKDVPADPLPAGEVVPLPSPMRVGQKTIVAVDATDTSAPKFLTEDGSTVALQPETITKLFPWLEVTTPPGATTRQLSVERGEPRGPGFRDVEGRKTPLPATDPPNPMEGMAPAPVEPYEFRPGQVEELEARFGPQYVKQAKKNTGGAVEEVPMFEGEPGARAVQLDADRKQLPAGPEAVKENPPTLAPVKESAPILEPPPADPLDELMATETFKAAQEPPPARRPKLTTQAVETPVTVGNATLHKVRTSDGRDAVEITIARGVDKEAKAQLKDAGFVIRRDKYVYNVPAAPRDDVRFNTYEEARSFAEGVFRDADAARQASADVPPAGEMGDAEITRMLDESAAADARVDAERINGAEPQVEVVDPNTETFRNNASGESSASMEAMQRQRDMAARGEQFVHVDKAGNITPLITTDAVDVPPPPGKIKGVVRHDGTFQLLDGTGRPPKPAEVQRIADTLTAPVDASSERMPQGAASPAALDRGTSTSPEPALDNAPAVPDVVKPEKPAKARRKTTDPVDETLDAPDADGYTRTVHGWRGAPEGKAVQGWTVGDTAGDGRTVQEIFEVPAKGKTPAHWRARMLNADARMEQNVDLDKLKPKAAEAPANPVAKQEVAPAKARRAPKVTVDKPESLQAAVAAKEADPEGFTEDAAQQVVDAAQPQSGKLFDDEGGTTLGSGLGGLQALGELFRKDPQAAWFAVRTGGGALLGGLYGEMTEEEGDTFEAAILGAGVGAGSRPMLKLLQEHAPAAFEAIDGAFKKDVWRSPDGNTVVSKRDWTKAFRASEGKPVVRRTPTGKDMSAFNATLGMPDRAVPDVFKKVRPILDSMDDQLSALAENSPPEFVEMVRKTYTNEAIATMRSAAAKSVAAGRTREADYIKALMSSVRNEPDAVIRTMMRGGFSRAAAQKTVGTATQLFYNNTLGLAIDSMVGNLTQSAITAVMIGPGDTWKGIKAAMTKEGKDATKFLALEKPLGMEDAKSWWDVMDKISNFMQIPMRATDTLNRRIAYLGAQQHALRRGADAAEARDFAMELTGASQGVPGDLGENPFIRQMGPIKALTKYPRIWAAFAGDALTHPDPAVRMRFFGLMVGAGVATQMFGMQLMNFVVPRVQGVPFAQAGIDVFKHATGSTDLDHEMEDHASIGGPHSAILPRYLEKTVAYAKRMAAHGTDDRPMRGRAGQRVRETSAAADTASLFGLETTANSEARDQRSDAYEFVQESRQEQTVVSRRAKRSASEALDRGDYAEADQFLNGLTGTQRRTFLRERNENPIDRLRRQVPRARREEFDQQFKR